MAIAAIFYIARKFKAKFDSGIEFRMGIDNLDCFSTAIRFFHFPDSGGL
jgi:hypothetical protein